MDSSEDSDERVIFKLPPSKRYSTHSVFKVQRDVSDIELRKARSENLAERAAREAMTSPTRARRSPRRSPRKDRVDGKFASDILEAGDFGTTKHLHGNKHRSVLTKTTKPVVPKDILPEASASQTTPNDIDSDELFEAPQYADASSDEESALEKKLEALLKHDKEKSIKIAELSERIDAMKRSIRKVKNTLEQTSEIKHEREFLLEQLALSQSETEDIKRDLRRLRHEKDVAERKLRNLSEEYQRLSTSYMNTELEIERCRQSINAFRIEADEKVDVICKELCNTIDENRVLIKHALKRRPEPFQREIRNTQEYLELQAKKMRINKQLEKQVTRLVKQELFINDLELDLAVAVNQLMKTGHDVSSIRIGHGPKYLEKFALNEKFPVEGRMYDKRMGTVPTVNCVPKCVKKQTNSDKDLAKMLDKQRAKKGGASPGASPAGSEAGEKKGLLGRVKTGVRGKVLGPMDSLMKDPAGSVKQEAQKQAVSAATKAPKKAAKGCCSLVCPCCC